ncbi:hypothetical protein CspeluHIS016_0209570 [Cutaneotrichosporon spelunceum]|uniref:Uncharacterized protein n=1 Tax=Cutaneotrichosporon spelunceum TaxID=1672016 RepID=A0AAD3TS34_9TREE|nr:hypothetical protein CspeluHIS016_0209570 [Cutaneotrichosporon spelunceum]
MTGTPTTPPPGFHHFGYSPMAMPMAPPMTPPMTPPVVPPMTPPLAPPLAPHLSPPMPMPMPMMTNPMPGTPPHFHRPVVPLHVPGSPPIPSPPHAHFASPIFAPKPRSHARYALEPARYVSEPYASPSGGNAKPLVKAEEVIPVYERIKAWRADVPNDGAQLAPELEEKYGMSRSSTKPQNSTKGSKHAKSTQANSCRREEAMPHTIASEMRPKLTHTKSAFSLRLPFSKK